VVHWLPVYQQILYKVAVIAFNGISGTGPAYIQQVCLLVADVTGQLHLHSAKHRGTLVPWTRTQLANAVSTLQLQLSGTHFRDGCALPPLVMDNSEMDLKPPLLQTYT